jgi:ankyrin repeat protein
MQTNTQRTKEILGDNLLAELSAQLSGVVDATDYSVEIINSLGETKVYLPNAISRAGTAAGIIAAVCNTENTNNLTQDLAAAAARSATGIAVSVVIRHGVTIVCRSLVAAGMIALVPTEVVVLPFVIAASGLGYGIYQFIESGCVDSLMRFADTGARKFFNSVFESAKFISDYNTCMIKLKNEYSPLVVHCALHSRLEAEFSNTLTTPHQNEIFSDILDILAEKESERYAEYFEHRYSRLEQGTPHVRELVNLKKEYDLIQREAEIKQSKKPARPQMSLISEEFLKNYDALEKLYQISERVVDIEEIRTLKTNSILRLDKIQQQKLMKSKQKKSSEASFIEIYIQEQAFNPGVIESYLQTPNSAWSQILENTSYDPFKAMDFSSMYMRGILNYGLGNYSSFSEYSQVLSLTGLSNSYNKNNSALPMFSSTTDESETGGVEMDSAVIKDLINSEAHACANEYYICFPRTDVSPDQYMQVAYELQEVYFKYKTMMMYSLNPSKQMMYSVMHPAYEHTLIGESFSFLDIDMKGLLHGAVYPHGFLKQWHGDRAALHNNFFDLKVYLKEKAPHLPYVTYSENLRKMGLADRVDANLGFCNFSQRLIGYQKHIERHGNILISEYGTRLAGEMSAGGDYTAYLNHCREQFGDYPAEYHQRIKAHEQFKESVSNFLPMLPDCRNYFDLLGVTNFFAYFYKTLEKMGKMPNIDKPSILREAYVPAIVPTFPLRTVTTHPLSLSFSDVIEEWLHLQGELALNRQLRELFEVRRLIELPKALLLTLREAVESILKEKLGFSILNDDEVNRITQTCGQIILQVSFQSQASMANNVKIILKRWPSLDSQAVIKIQAIAERLFQAKTWIIQQFELRKTRWSTESTLGYYEIFQLAPSSAHIAIQAELDRANAYGKIQETAYQQLEKIITVIRDNNNLSHSEQIAYIEKNPIQGVTNLDELIKSLSTDTSAFEENIVSYLTLLERFKLSRLANIRRANTEPIVIMEKNYHYHLSVLDANLKQMEKYASYLQSVNYVLAIEYLESSLTASESIDLTGGAEMALSEITSKPIVQGEMFAQEIATQFESASTDIVPITWKQKNYWAMRVRVKDTPQCGVKVYEAIPEKMTAVSEKNTTVLDSTGATRMHYAAMFSTPATLANAMQQAPVEMTVADKQGYLPIHIAAKEGRVEAAEVILNKFPAQLNVESLRKLTPLMLSIENHHLEMVRMLLKRGACANTNLSSGLYPLYVAVKNSDIEIALQLIEKTTIETMNTLLDKGHTVLHAAVDKKLISITLGLIDKGANYEQARNSDSYTPLHCAVIKGQLEVIKACAKKKILTSSIRLPHTQKSLVHLAALSGNRTVFEYLLSQGFSLDDKTVDNETPLMLAIKKGHRDLATYLAEISPVNRVNNEGESTALLATQHQMPDVAARLIERGENSALTDKKGMNCLYYLVKNNEYFRLTKLIPSHSTASISASMREAFSRKYGEQQKTLIEIASQHHYMPIVYFLQKVGCVFQHDDSNLALLTVCVEADEIITVEDSLTMRTDERKLLIKTLVSTATAYSAQRCLMLFLAELTPNDCVELNLLAVAIKSNCPETLQKILIKWPSIKAAVDAEGNGPFHWAVIHHADRLVQPLKEAGVDLMLKNRLEQTAFHLAIDKKNAQILEELLAISTTKDQPVDLPESDCPQILALLKKQPKSQLPAQAVQELQNYDDVCTPQIMSEIEIALCMGNYADVLEQWDEASTVRSAFLGSSGGLLFYTLFQHIQAFHLSRQDDSIEGELLPVQQLLRRLVHAGFNPAYFLNSQNVLKTMFLAENDEIAIFRLNLLATYFKEALPILVQDKPDFLRAVPELSLLHQKYEFHERLDEICQTIVESNKILPPFRGLHEAVLLEKPELIQKFLKKYSVDLTDNQGRTALMFAANKNNLKLVELFLSHGANVDIVDHDGHNAWHHAISVRAEAIAYRLLPHLSDKEKVDKQGRTPLMWASYCGMLSMVRYYCEKKDETQIYNHEGKNALHIASMMGRLEIIEYLVSHGFSINQPTRATLSKVSTQNGFALTPLHIAAGVGRASAVQKLLALGADPTLEDSNQYTFIEYAIIKNDPETIRLIKQQSIYYSPQREPIKLLAIVVANNLAILDEMIMNDVNLNVVEANTGRTLLHQCAVYNSIDVAKRLLKGGDIVVDLQDCIGNTALHHAAFRGFVGMIECLSPIYSSLNQVNNKHETALFLGCAKGHLGVVLSLIKQGADCTISNREGLTPLQIALYRGHVAVAVELALRGDHSGNNECIEQLDPEKRDKIQKCYAEFQSQSKKLMQSSIARFRYGFYHIAPATASAKVASPSLTF